ncbi:hypothetical protein ACFX13_029633 [Malus domestica]
MEALSFQTLLQLPSAPRKTLSYVEKDKSKNNVAKNLHERVHSSTAKRLPRRLFLQYIGFCPVLFSNPVFAAPMPEMKEPEIIRSNLGAKGYVELLIRKLCLICDCCLEIEALRTVKLPSGVRVQEIVEGQGPIAHEGDLVEINYVCRRTNGYFVHSTVDQFSGESAPVILPLDEKQIIEGLKEVLVGMKTGGKRRALIPPYVGYTNENLKPIPEEFGPRRSLLSHVNEPLIFEVQLLKVL